MAQAVMQEKEQDIQCPSIIFKIHGGLYSLNSRYVRTIMQLPEYHPLPEAPQAVPGIFMMRGQPVPLLDMRALFGLSTHNEEYLEAQQMFEQRKLDHIHWMESLEHCAETNEPFELATDPHQCALGRWYDSYHSDNPTLTHHLRQIEEPHRLLHEAALELLACERDCDNCKNDECKKNILEKARQRYMPQVLKLLDECIELFRSEMHRDMVLVLFDEKLSQDGRVGLVVDEVLAVEELGEVAENGQLGGFYNGQYIEGVVQSERISGNILALREQVLLDAIDQLSY